MLTSTTRDIGTDLVTLEVGATKQKHVVHKDLLTKDSPYFQAMFKGPWEEASLSEPANLTMINEKVFPGFLDWLYFRTPLEQIEPRAKSGARCTVCKGNCVKQSTGAIKAGLVELEDLTEDEDAECEALITEVLTGSDSLIANYILADQIDIPALRESYVNMVWLADAKNLTFTSYVYTAAIYRALPASSPLCRLVADAAVKYWGVESEHHCRLERKLRSKVPANFWFILATKLKAGAGKQQGCAVGLLCDYHEHAQDEKTRARCASKLSSEAKQMRGCFPAWGNFERKRKREVEDVGTGRGMAREAGEDEDMYN